MSMPRAAQEFRAAQVNRSVRTVALSRAAWARMPEDFDNGWATVGPRLAAIVALGQMGAATDGAQYVANALLDEGSPVTPDALVVPSGLAGRTSSGGSLDSLLYGAVVHAKQAQVDTFSERLLAGSKWLSTVVHTTVADASRDATMAATVARPGVQWVRVASVPCCQRCAVLAGRVYRYSHGFDRHPNDECTMLPTTVANPHAAGIVIGPDDVHDLTPEQRQRIADGEDFNKVINDYQRHPGDFLPPTRVDKLTAKQSRSDAVESLISAGVLDTARPRVSLVRREPARVSLERREPVRVSLARRQPNPAPEIPKGSIADRVAFPQDALDALNRKGGWSQNSRDETIAALKKTEDGKRLLKTLQSFQNGGAAVPRLRGDIERYLRGEQVSGGRRDTIETLLSAIGRSKAGSSSLWRGMGIPGDFEAVAAKYNVGDRIDMSLASFTTDKRIAQKFAIEGDGKRVKAKKRTRVIVEWVGDDKRALPVEHVSPSHFLSREKEWIGAGRYSIVGKRRTKRNGIETLILQVRQDGGW